MKNFDKLHEGIKRAMEVALTAGFDFALVDKTPNGFYRGIFEHNTTEIPESKLDCLCIVETDQPAIEQLFGGMWESFEEMEQRIDNTQPKINTENLYDRVKESDVTFQLLKKSFNVYEGTYIEVLNCLKLAETIRCLCDDDKIKANHMAEAIIYSFVR